MIKNIWNSHYDGQNWTVDIFKQFSNVIVDILNCHFATQNAIADIFDSQNASLDVWNVIMDIQLKTV